MSLISCLRQLQRLSLLAAIALNAGYPAGSTAVADHNADVVIYGATSAGVVAAIQADRMGRSVILIEPGHHLGGLTSGGLGWTDSGNKGVIGGIAREFYRAVKAHYDRPESWLYERAEDYDRYRADDDAMWTFEPRVAEEIFRDMLGETQVILLERQRLARELEPDIVDGRIQSISLESGLQIGGKIFMDATYEGDLMAAAGVPYHVGRESNSKYDETLNGNQVRANTHNHRFIRSVSPFRITGDPSSGLLPLIESGGAGVEGEGDSRIQAYCFRMCMSRIPENSVPFPRPDDYDETRYELLFRNFEAGDLRFPMKPDMMPNGKTDTNNNCAVSTDYIGANYAYPEASYAEREQIVKAHESWQKGLMWTLASHPRVPAAIRDEMNQWGLARDEFVDNGNWPHQLYIRESRRMVSDYVMTEWDCRRETVCTDSVGLGSYNMDSHNVRRFVTDDGFVQNEGDVQVSPGGAYLISYRSLIPPRDSVSNLLVPVCLSASHIAYGSIRMEPVFMILGQSAATAAVQSIENGQDVQDMDYQQLRRQLLDDGQVLDLPEGTRTSKLLLAARLPGVVVDDGDADFQGNWTFSTSTSSFVGNGYRHDNDAEKGGARAVFRFPIRESGRVEVRMSYSPHTNRATNVPVTIESPEHRTTITVNQRDAPGVDGVFHALGVVSVEEGTTVIVTIDNVGTDGHVIADAVQLLPLPE